MNKVGLKVAILVIVSSVMFIAGCVTFNIIYVKDENKNIIKTLERAADKISSEYKVLGRIRIEKLNIEYPILVDSSEKAMKVSVVKLFGSDPKEKGNMCIAGNNTKNNLFFSNLVMLENGDEIIIKDKENKIVKYAVYDVYTTTYNDSEFMSQQTGGKREVTLVTDTVNLKRRIVVRAREI